VSFLRALWTYEVPLWQALILVVLVLSFIEVRRFRALKKYVERKLPTECCYGHRGCIHDWGHDCMECAVVGRKERLLDDE